MFVTGTCKDEVSGYQCECIEGFNGTLCENNIDDCVNHTCNNNSLCQDGVNNYSCVCKTGKFVFTDDCAHVTYKCVLRIAGLLESKWLYC